MNKNITAISALAGIFITSNIFAAWNNGIYFQSANISGIDFTSSTVVHTGMGQSGTMYKDLDLSFGNFILANASNANFFGKNLMRTTFSEARLTNANFTSADLRGSQYYVDIKGTPITKNTIWINGNIKTNGVDGLSLTNNTDLIYVRKYEENPYMPSANINAVISTNSAASGGAKIVIDDGGVLEIKSGVSFGVSNATFEFYLSDEINRGLLLVNGSLSISAETMLNLYLTDEFSLSDFKGIEFVDISNGLFSGTFLDENTNVFNADGSVYIGDWSLSQTATGIGINFSSIPEPAEYAAMFGIIVLCFAAYRRCRK